LTCLLFRLEDDDRESLVVRRIEPIPSDEPGSCTKGWQDVVRQHCGCRRSLIRVNRQRHEGRIHGFSVRRWVSIVSESYAAAPTAVGE